MRDIEVYNVGHRRYWRCKARYGYRRVAHWVKVVYAHVGQLKQIFARRVAYEVVGRHFVLPVGAGYGNYFYAVFLCFQRRVYCCGVYAYVMENYKQIVFFKEVVLKDEHQTPSGLYMRL